MSSELYDPLGLGELDPAPLAPQVAGLPGDRAAHQAAHRAFVEMKQLFARSVAGLAHRKAPWLREQVRMATDPGDLWLLRGPLLAALRGDDSARGLRAELYRTLDDTFPRTFGQPGPMTARRTSDGPRKG